MTWHNDADRRMHYSDHSHNWLAPPEVDQEVWSAMVRAHMQAHLDVMGGAPLTAGGQVCALPALAERRAGRLAVAAWRTRRIA